MIDRWEKQIAQGITPDLSEGMLPEERQRYKEHAQQVVEAKQKKEAEKQQKKLDTFFTRDAKDISDMYAQGFSDNYRDGR